MEIEVDSVEFSKALVLAQNMVGKRSTMPILSNILLIAEDKSLTVQASDGSISCRIDVGAKISKEGRTTVNAKVFSDLIRELPPSSVKLQLSSGERLNITAGGSRFKLNGIPADEYPSLRGMGLEPSHTFKKDDLLEMISKTAYASSTDESRFTLNGVCFEEKTAGKDTLLSSVATDGHRLALLTRPVKKLSLQGRPIVPRRAVQEVKKLLEDDSLVTDSVSLCFEEGFFVLKGQKVKFAAQLIDGEYPDYAQVIPSKKGYRTTVKVADLVQSLRRMVLVVSDKEKGVKLTFSNTDLELSSSSPDLGEAQEKIEINYDGPAMTAGFNAQYLIDAVTTLSSTDGEVVFELRGELEPLKISAVNDDAAIAIVMPMRL